MRLEIEPPALYVDGLFLCYAGAGNGSAAIRPGRYACEAANSHAHGARLVRADGLGWLGADRECAVVLGAVRNRDDVVPCPTLQRRLLALVDTAGERGQAVELIVK